MYTKEQDHEKRKTGTGSYSPYNYIYHYLMDNFEPKQDLSGASELLQREYKAYCMKCGIAYDQNTAINDIKNAINNFASNNGEHGDTANNLGKVHSAEGSFNNIKGTIADLRW